MPLFLSLAAALIPALFWLFLFLKKDYKDPEPYSMIFRAFLWGALCALPFGVLGIFFPESISAFFGIFGIFAAVIFRALFEEWLKHFSVLQLGTSLHLHFNQIVDGIIYSVSAALGFSFFENALYFFFLMQQFSIVSPEFTEAFAGRALFTTFGHALFSGVFGLFWGHAFLSKTFSSKHTISATNFFHGLRRTLTLHVLRHHILPRKPSAHGHEAAEIVAEGFFLATLLHTVFNLLLEFPDARIPLILLLGLPFFILTIAFEKKNYTKILHPL